MDVVIRLRMRTQSCTEPHLCTLHLDGSCIGRMRRPATAMRPSPSPVPVLGSRRGTRKSTTVFPEALIINAQGTQENLATVDGVSIMTMTGVVETHLATPCALTETGALVISSEVPCMLTMTGGEVITSMAPSPITWPPLDSVRHPKNWPRSSILLLNQLSSVPAVRLMVILSTAAQSCTR